MDEYFKDRNCSKCGNDWITTRYERSGYGGEHIKRRCCRCNYVWNEKCLSENSDELLNKGNKS